MSYRIPVRMGAMAIGTGLALLAALTCWAAAPGQPAGTVEVVVSPPPSTPIAAPAAPADLPKEPKEVQAIRLAGNPSAAVQAYAEAIKLNDKNPAVFDTYIRRMMGFGMVEILGAPAQALIKLDPNNGLGWAVLGFTQAKQGNMPAAFDDAVKATQASPSDPFVLQFAGQLAGWYAHQAGQEGLPPSILEAVLKLREFAAKPAYIQGYTAASNAITGPAPTAPGTAAATTTQTPQAASAAPEASGTYYTDTTGTMPPADSGNYYSSYTESPIYYSSNYYPDYTAPYNYSGYSGGYYMPYASPYYGGFGLGGFGPSFIVTSPLFFGHHRFFDHDHDADDFRGNRALTNSKLFFNSAAKGTLAQQRAMARSGTTVGTDPAAVRSTINRAATTGALRASNTPTVAAGRIAPSTVTRSAVTPSFSAFGGSSTGRWNTMGVAGPRAEFRGNTAAPIAPRATFSAPQSFGGAARFNSGAIRMNSGGSFRSSGGVAHFSSSGGGGGARFSGGGGHFSGGGGRSGGRR